MLVVKRTLLVTAAIAEMSAHGSGHGESSVNGGAPSSEYG